MRTSSIRIPVFGGLVTVNRNCLVLVSFRDTLTKERNGRPTRICLSPLKISFHPAAVFRSMRNEKGLRLVQRSAQNVRSLVDSNGFAIRSVTLVLFPPVSCRQCFPVSGVMRRGRLA